jgi:hypothetical protein
MSKNLWKSGKCCLCAGRYEHFGNNPAPLKNKGRCCDKCNTTKVILERLKLFRRNLGEKSHE